QVAAPRPATDLAEALLVDVEDDDAVLARARHRHREARVVHDVVELGDEADALGAQCIAYEEQRDRKAQPDPYDVLSQIGPFRPAVATSRLKEEFHLDAGQFDDVVVLERMGRGADFLAVDAGTLRAFDVGDEVALGPPRQDSDLHTRLAERRERLGELELLA